MGAFQIEMTDLEGRVWIITLSTLLGAGADGIVVEARTGGSPRPTVIHLHANPAGDRPGDRFVNLHVK